MKKRGKFPVVQGSSAASTEIDQNAQKLILGVSIDESVSAAIAVTSRRAIDEIRLLDGIALGDSDTRIKAIRNYLRRLGPRVRKMTGREPLHSVCISTIGVVDRGPKQSYILRSVARRGWPVKKPLLDVSACIHSAFSYFPETPPLFTYNNMVACMIAEFEEGYGTDPDVRADFAKDQVMAGITLGEGINAGVIVSRQVLSNTRHPELGHLVVKPHEADAALGYTRGTCGYHTGCVEGMASIPAILERWQCTADDLPAILSDPGKRDVIAYYAASLCVSLTLTVAPSRIIIGGRLPRISSDLLEDIRRWTCQMLGRYPYVKGDYILASWLPEDMALRGALHMARYHAFRPGAEAIMLDFKVLDGGAEDENTT